MLKRKESNKTELSLPAFKKFNESIFYDDTIPQDTFTPLNDTQANCITTEELNTVL
jgi:hypothetical protein